jgi:N-acetyl-alpha-D-glucosaminyl L-malate synthase BshA
MKIGITCYPSVGGSGIVATELGCELARRGHEIHFITYQMPYRLDGRGRICFHQVQTADYPVFKSPPYTLALAAKMAEVASLHGLDLFHVHYAVPHATSAYLARQMTTERRVHLVTTLHGTDITLVGADPSFFRITKFSIEQSDGVTAVSEFLRRETFARFGVPNSIEAIPNFVDTEEFSPARRGDVRAQFGFGSRPIVMHVSNFRRVKNVRDVVKIFAHLPASLDAMLVLVGDGPERGPVATLVEEYGLTDRVVFMGDRREVEAILPAADLFLLPSSHESFGLSALEAMSCGVPVIGCRAGGLPEVVADGETGRLFEVGDVSSMARAAEALLADPAAREGMGSAGRARAIAVYSKDRIVDRYEAFYQRVSG